MAVPPSSPSTGIVSPNNNKKSHKRKKTKSSGAESKKQSDSSQEEAADAPPASSPPRKRRKCPGVRLIGGRIYDSENGKSCHQCRQKTMDFVASCKNQRNNKACLIKFCYKCLFNRYGEKAEDMELLGDWECPKCRGICNCSFCMKRRGHQPTGILVHTAKATGFSSVSEMLQVQGPENITASPRKLCPPNKVVASTTEDSKENSFARKCDTNLQTKPLESAIDGRNIKSIKQKKLGHKHAGNGSEGSNDDNAEAEKNTKPEEKKREKSCISSELSPSSRVEEEKVDDRPGGAQKRRFKTSRVSKEVNANAIKKVKGRKSDVNGSGLVVKNYISENSCFELTKKEEKLDKRDHSSPAYNKQSESCDNVEENCKMRRGLHKSKNSALRICNNENDVDTPLPEGIGLKTIAGIDFPAKDIGHALQFLEFCKTFEEVLDLKQGLPELVLQELMHGCGRCRGQHSSIVRFHNQLLGLIQKDTGEKSPLISTSNGNSWLQELCKCISDSQFALKELPSDCFNIDDEGYKTLDASTKLRLLIFLCDEALCTENLRGWIDEQNSKLLERRKEAKEKVFAAKEKERRMKQKMRNEIVKAILLKNGAPLSISEHENLVSKIKIEAAKAHAQRLEAGNMLQKERSDAVGTQPLFFDGNGHVFWRLRGYSVEPNILSQDIGCGDMAATEEKWFTYDVEHKQDVENYISSLRRKRLRMQVVPDAAAS